MVVMIRFQTETIKLMNIFLKGEQQHQKLRPRHPPVKLPL